MICLRIFTSARINGSESSQRHFASVRLCAVRDVTSRHVWGLDFLRTEVLSLISALKLLSIKFPDKTEPILAASYEWQARYKTSYEGVSKSFRTGRLERELQMIKLSATRCSCIAVLWVSLVSFAAITLCVVSQWVFIVVGIHFVIDSVRKLLDTPPYIQQKCSELVASWRKYLEKLYRLLQNLSQEYVLIFSLNSFPCFCYM
jgi:hypothetical protein